MSSIHSARSRSLFFSQKMPLRTLVGVLLLSASSPLPVVVQAVHLQSGRGRQHWFMKSSTGRSTSGRNGEIESAKPVVHTEDPAKSFNTEAGIESTTAEQPASATFGKNAGRGAGGPTVPGTEGHDLRTEYSTMLLPPVEDVLNDQDEIPASGRPQLPPTAGPGKLLDPDQQDIVDAAREKLAGLSLGFGGPGPKRKASLRSDRTASTRLGDEHQGAGASSSGPVSVNVSNRTSPDSSPSSGRPSGELPTVVCGENVPPEPPAHLALPHSSPWSAETKAFIATDNEKNARNRFKMAVDAASTKMTSPPESHADDYHAQHDEVLEKAAAASDFSAESDASIPNYALPAKEKLYKLVKMTTRMAEEAAQRDLKFSKKYRSGSVREMKRHIAAEHRASLAPLQRSRPGLFQKRKQANSKASNKLVSKHRTSAARKKKLLVFLQKCCEKEKCNARKEFSQFEAKMAAVLRERPEQPEAENLDSSSTSASSNDSCSVDGEGLEEVFQMALEEKLAEADDRNDFAQNLTGDLQRKENKSWGKLQALKVVGVSQDVLDREETRHNMLRKMRQSAARNWMRAQDDVVELKKFLEPEED